MRFSVVGLNHKECPVEVREQLSFSDRRLREALVLAKSDARLSELVIVSTCNRVEFYVFSAAEDFREALLELVEHTHSIRRETFLSYLYTYESKEAVVHLFRVAAGLDSLVVGENEILGQVREAFKAADEAGTVHSLLYRLMEKALKAGKDVRSETRINEGAVSIPSVAVELAEKIFGRLAGEKVMVVGTGEMGALTLKNLKGAGAEVLSIVSRSQERGERLALEFGSEWIPYDSWQRCLTAADILIASTEAPHPVIHFEQVKRVMEARRHRPLFLIDIAVPRNIAPEVNSIADVYLYNVDDLKGVAAANLRLRRREIRAAEAVVEQAVIDYQSWLEQLKARPSLERFERFLDSILDRELSRFVKEIGANEGQKNEIHRRIRAKLLHPPLEKIKEASQNGGVTRYLEALHSLFGLDKEMQNSKIKNQNEFKV